MITSINPDSTYPQILLLGLDAQLTLLTEQFKVLVFKDNLPEPREYLSFAEKVNSELKALHQLLLVGANEEAQLALALALLNPKVVRRLVLINAASRPRPTLLSRVIDQVESFLPLGLPLRKLSDEFDARSFLHRIDAPTLCVTTRQAPSFLNEQADFMSQKIPNAWRVKDSEDITALLNGFKDTPAKRPQKNRA